MGSIATEKGPGPLSPVTALQLLPASALLKSPGSSVPANTVDGVVGPQGSGTTYRFLLSTLSWFDLVTREALQRPSLEQLAAGLNELEGTTPTDPAAWRAQPTDGPSSPSHDDRVPRPPSYRSAGS